MTGHENFLEGTAQPSWKGHNSKNGLDSFTTLSKRQKKESHTVCCGLHRWGNLSRLQWHLRNFCLQNCVWLHGPFSSVPQCQYYHWKAIPDLSAWQHRNLRIAYHINVKICDITITHLNIFLQRYTCGKEGIFCSKMTNKFTSKLIWVFILQWSGVLDLIDGDQGTNHSIASTIQRYCLLFPKYPCLHRVKWGLETGNLFPV